MSKSKNPYQDLIENEPDFFGVKNRVEGAVITKGLKLTTTETLASEFDIIEALKTIEDPEIPVNLYDLGLIYKITQSKNGDVSIVMTLTAPNCPVAGEMPTWVANTVSKVVGVGVVNVSLTWEPKWTKELMSDDAKLALDI